MKTIEEFLKECEDFVDERDALNEEKKYTERKITWSEFKDEIIKDFKDEVVPTNKISKMVSKIIDKGDSLDFDKITFGDKNVIIYSILMNIAEWYKPQNTVEKKILKKYISIL